MDGVSGTLGFPLERRLSLLLTTMLIAAVGVNEDALATPLGGWAFAVAFRREVLAGLDVSHTAAATLPPCRGCRVNDAQLDELLLVTGIAPLLQTNLREKTCSKLYATDGVELAAALHPSHKRHGSPFTIWLKRRRNTDALIGKAKNDRATFTMDVERPHHLFWSWIGT